jgi:hypothetical protein
LSTGISGTFTNTAGPVTSTNGIPGNIATAGLIVEGPAIAMAFSPAPITPGASSALDFTITNPPLSLAELTGVAFTATLPAGLTAADGSSTVCGGTLTISAGNTISLSGATAAAGSSCAFPVEVTAAVAGIYTATSTAVTAEGYTTGNSASATLIVEGPPVLAMAFSPATIMLGASSTLSFTVTNPAANPEDFTGVAFTATLPAGLTVANGSSTVCGGTVTVSASNTISLSGATIAAGSSCVFSIQVTASAAGTYTATTTAVTSAGFAPGNSATANQVVAAAPVASPTASASATPVASATPIATSAAVASPTPPSTSTGARAPGGSDVPMLFLLLLVSVAGLIALSRVQIRDRQGS